MATQSRRTFSPIAEQGVMRQGLANYKGSGVGTFTLIGYVPASESSTGIEQLYRELQKYTFSWPADMYQVLDAWVDLTPAVPTEHGSSPRISVAAIGGDFSVVGGEATSGTYTDNGADDTTNWARTEQVLQPIQIFPAFADGSVKQRLHIAQLIEEIAPERVKRRNGAPSGGKPHYGFAFSAFNETTKTNRWAFLTSRWTDAAKWPQVTIVYSTSTPPSAPIVDLLNGEVPDTSGITTVGSATSRILTVEFTSNTPGDTADRVELQVYANGAIATEDDPAQPVVGTLIATTGAIAPTPTGTANRYTVTLSSLHPRPTLGSPEVQLYRLRVRNSAGVWGPYTPLASGRIQTAYLPGKPIDPRMTPDAANPVVSATLASNDPADGVTGIRGTFVKDNPDGTSTNLWPDMGTIDIAYVAGVKRAVITRWGGVGLLGGDRVRWRVQLRNRDLIWSPLSDEVITTVRTLVGPTFTPSDTSTKLDSRTGPITISDILEFDSYRFRLYRNDVLIYTSPITGVTPTLSEPITLPAGLLNWSDTFGIEAETRPTGTGTFGPTSTRATLYINALPTTTLTAQDEDGNSGSVIGTTDVIWHAPYVDADAARYGETPVTKLLELRHAATPQGSGALIDQRLSVAELKPIDEDEESGYQVLPLADATGWVPDANVSTGTTASGPTGYTGNSLRLTFAASSTPRGATYTFPTPLDWSRFGSHTYLGIWRKLSSEGNLTKLVVGVTTAAGWAEWTIYDPPSDGTATWSRAYGFLGFPDDGSGTVDWSSVESLWVHAYVSGSFAGTVDLRDLTIGFEVLDTSPPDASFGIAFEQSYDARVRYRDTADVLVTTALSASASASATNLKVDSVTGLAAGQEVTIESDTARTQETRTIASVGTAGSGGTGVTLADALFYGHSAGATVRILPWGPNSAWRTIKVSEPPTVALSVPADAATVTDAGQVLSWVYGSPSGKAESMATVRIYATVAGAQQLVHEADLAAIGAYAIPYYLLENGVTYAWEVTVYDSDGLATTSERRTFTASLAIPDPVTDLVATTDPIASTVTLGWSASPGAAFYVVRWRDADGQWVRKDLGPRSVADGGRVI